MIHKRMMLIVLLACAILGGAALGIVQSRAESGSSVATTVQSGTESSEESTTTTSAPSLAQLETAAVADLLQEEGLTVIRAGVSSREATRYEFEISVSTHDQYVRDYATACRVLTLAKADKVITTAFADVVLTMMEGKRAHHLRQIVDVPTGLWSEPTTDSLASARATLEPQIRALNSKYGTGLEFKSITVDLDHSFGAISIDLVMPASGDVGALQQLMDWVWSTVRQYNDSKATIAVGYMRLFDPSGRQLVIEECDFVGRDGMIWADENYIKYPNDR